MMLGRRIFQRAAWGSCRRWLPQCPSPVRNRIASSLTGYKLVPDSLPNNSLNFKFNILRAGNSRSFGSHAVADLPAGTVVDVPLAQTGEGIAECEVLKWFVQEGDEVAEFQPLCEVQSDKATIEITSRYKGKVAQILHVPGNIVKVGESLLKMAVDEGVIPTIPPEVPDVVNGRQSVCSEPSKDTADRVLSTPVVRNLAKEHGIIINDIQGSGKDGRVLREDVLKHASEKVVTKGPSVIRAANFGDQLRSVGSQPFMSDGIVGQHDDQTLLLRGFQRAMVKTMSAAAKVPHFHYVEEINCDALVELRACFQANNTEEGLKFTFLPVLVKSLSMALIKYPLMNSCFNEETVEVILKGSHNVGIAMATPSGLVVPNIKNVKSLSVYEVTKELSRLQQLAVENKLTPTDISGGTISLSNIGSIGGKFGSPLLNLPEVSIITIGRVEKVPRFGDDGAVHPASIMTVNIAADHRVLDGATVARFCNEWKKFIEKPELLMLHLK